MTKLQEAIASVRASLGLNNTPSSWTYDQRIAYNKALADYISESPEVYDEQTQATAAYVASVQYSPLDDDSVLSDLQTFGGAFADEVINAGDSVAGVGQGFLSGLSLTRWLIPLALVIAVGILLWGFYKKQTA